MADLRDKQIKEGTPQVWIQIFAFMISEVFGGEILSKYQNFEMASFNHEEDGVINNVILDPFEKEIYIYIRSGSEYLIKNRRRLPSGEVVEKTALLKGLMDVWWALLKLNHQDLQDHQSIGIRKGFQLVYSKNPYPRGPGQMIAAILSEHTPE